MTAGETGLRERLARPARRHRCRLIHEGRKTGRRREFTVWFLVNGSFVHLVAADRRRQWVQNVLARPGVELRIDGSRAHLWLRRAPDATLQVRIAA